MSAARVAVLLPVAPGAAWLRECLQSLRSQSYDDWELVVVLDGACTTNRGVLEDAGLGGQVIELPAGSGVARALNAGLSSTDAPLVARMDADDVCEPERLSLQVAELMSRPEVWVLGTWAREMDVEGVLGRVRAVPVGARQVRRTLAWRNAIIHPSVLMRRREILGLGGYDVRSDRAQDYELWLRVAAVAELDNLGVPLLRYRLHADQHSRGARLAASAQIRRARHAGAAGLRGHVAADLRHAAWVAAQAARGR